MDQRVAVRAQSAQLRSEAARLRQEVARSRQDIRASTRAALHATETMYSRLHQAPACVPDRRPWARDPLVEQLEARLATLPVIEQAKGILMAKQGCDPDEAFDILRRASSANTRSSGNSPKTSWLPTDSHPPRTGRAGSPRGLPATGNSGRRLCSPRCFGRTDDRAPETDPKQSRAGSATVVAGVAPATMGRYPM
jgi:hypothetical protein